MQNVLSGTISVVQCSLSIGTVWKSSSSSEYSDEMSVSWSLSELSEVNVSWQWCTGLGEVSCVLHSVVW